MKLIYAFQEAANLQILKANSTARLSALERKTYVMEGEGCEPAKSLNEVRQNTIENCLKTAETLALRGLVLIEQIQDSGVDRNDHELMNHKSRLLQFGGLASRYDPDRKGYSRHAMSMMGDAVATLSEAEPLFARAEQGVIDIRRADIRLREAAAIKLFDESEFERWTYDRLRGSSIHAPVLGNIGKPHIEVGDDGTYFLILEGFRKSPASQTQIAISIELKKAWQRVSVFNEAHECLAESERDLRDNEVLLADSSQRSVQLEMQKQEIELASGADTAQFTDDYTVALNSHEWYENKLKRNQGHLEKDVTSGWTRVAGLETKKLATDCTKCRSLETARLRESLREIVSRATDALRFLDRAEPILRERRRNVAWTTCYFELRLRAISLILWASIVQEGTPIPYLGLEAAMRKSETEPDQILNDAVRMIRVDSYRLAMIVLTYASCARALQIRLALDHAAVRLPERLSQMRHNLDHAIRHLETVHERRISTPSEQKKSREGESTGSYTDKMTGKSAVDPVVNTVVKEVLERVKDVLSGLKPDQENADHTLATR